MITSRMKLPFNFQRQKSISDEYASQSQQLPIQPEETTSSSEEEDQHRWASSCAAHDLIHDLIKSDDRWSSHMPLIRIDCPYTLTELHALGKLPQAEGVAACCKLIRVPVIYEEIGLFLWTQLASLARGRPNSAEISACETTEDIRIQSRYEALLAYIDERSCFDSLAAASTREMGAKDSPPVSPMQSPGETPQRTFMEALSSSEPSQRSRPAKACRLDQNDSIEECDEGQEENSSETRGRIASRVNKELPAAVTRPDVERKRSFFSSGKRNGSQVSTLRQSREQGTTETASRASSVSRKRSGSLAGRLGSAVGGLGQRVVGTKSLA